MSSIYVDAATGSDTNTGYVGYPVATLGRAATILTDEPSVKTVNIAAGTYQEELDTVKDSVSYIASGTVIIDGETSRNGVHITHNNISVIGIDVINATTAILADTVSNASVTNCDVSDSTAGIVFDTVASGSIINCTAHDVGGSSINYSGGSSGIIRNCTAYNFDDRGFHVYNAANSIVENCCAYTALGAGSSYAFEIEYGADNTQVIDCQAEDAVHGFIFKKVTGCSVTGSTSTNIHTGDGFYSKDADNQTYTNCETDDCHVGFEINYDSDDSNPSINNSIQNCTISNSVQYGILLENGSDSGFVSDYNTFDTNAVTGRKDSTNYTTLAEWQALGYDADSEEI